MTIRQQDIFDFVKGFDQADEFYGAKFLITGGTGLIGSILVDCLVELKKEIQISLPVRNVEKAFALYGEKSQDLNIVQCDLVDYLSHLDEDFDYIVHCASPTAGKYMVDHPVETFTLAIDSTKAILEYCRRKQVKAFVYVSSLEYFGEVDDDRIITEEMLGYVDYSSARSSYPLGKRAAEYLCRMYAKEYGIPVKVARLTQTFGAGISSDDNRVFAQFARSILSGQDIVLHTKGDSAKPYCYTTDCVSAILYVALKGEIGNVYNVANEETYISILDMAKFLCENFNPLSKVIIEEHPEYGYASVTKLHLSTEKLLSLGWKPKYGLKEMYNRLIESLK